MAQLKEIRTRIASVKSTLQVTSAMKMVSAAKLKKAQDSFVRISAYDDNLARVMNSLRDSCEDNSNPFFSRKETKKVLVVIIGTNKGLCGGFNVNVVKYAIDHINNYNSENHYNCVFDVLAIGNQVFKELKSRNISIINDENVLGEKVEFEAVALFVNSLIAKYLRNEYQQIDIVYNSFKNAAVQVLRAEQFLPVKSKQENNFEANSVNYLYEPSVSELLQIIIPQGLKNHFYKIVLESNVAEHGARMVAMQFATDNATELLKELKSSYNNARQSAITNEIMDITGGSEALRKA